MNAVRQCQALRQEADVAEVTDDTVGEIRIHPGALIDGLQEMHVDASAGQRRIIRHRLQQRL